MTNAHIDAQIINGPDGTPEFAVIPYKIFQKIIGEKDYSDHVPHEVVSKMIDGDPMVKAWREYLGLTQVEVAGRMGITQAAYSQMENAAKIRSSSRRKIADALGIKPEQLV